MRVLVFLSVTALLLLAVPAGAIQLVNSSVISGLGGHVDINPIYSVDGEYHGTVAADAVNDKVDVYDADGSVLHSFSMPNNVRKAIARYSDNGDTLVVYVLQDTTWVWNDNGNVDVFRISVIKDVGDSISTLEVWPHCVTQNLVDEFWIWDASISFDYDNQSRPKGVTFQETMTQSYHVMTMGTTTTRFSTLIAYNLDITMYSASVAAESYVSGHRFDGDTCGWASTFNWSQSVVDDPWNSYSSSGTYIRVNNCGVSLVGMSGPGSSSFVVAGDFIPSVPGDELIYAGSAKDIVGWNDTLIGHWACYSVTANVLTEEWWIPPPRNFAQRNYLDRANLLLGLFNNRAIGLFDCENGVMADSIPLERPMANISFMMSPAKEFPYLFGRINDTVFVYDFGSVTDVNETGPDGLPDNYRLSQNYPNPFNPTTEISFSLPRAADVRLDVYNILGRRVVSLVNDHLSAGLHTVSWDGKDLDGRSVSSGIYLYRIQAGSWAEAKKMLLLK